MGDNVYKDIVNTHIPTCLAKVRKCSLPWINSEIHKAMNNRYKLLKLCNGTLATLNNWQEYKQARNRVTNLLHSAETQYWREKFTEANNPRTFWKTVGRITGKRKHSIIGPISDENGLEILDDCQNANLFNFYFVSIGREITESFPNTTESSHTECQICYILNEQLKKFSLKSPSQWGFTKGFSAEGMLLTMTDRWKMKLDKGLIIRAIFVDFKKAFDSISQDILSLKIQAI